MPSDKLKSKLFDDNETTPALTPHKDDDYKSSSSFKAVEQEEELDEIKSMPKNTEAGELSELDNNDETANLRHDDSLNTDDISSSFSEDNSNPPPNKKRATVAVLGIVFMAAAVFAGVLLVRQRQLLNQEAASGSACNQSPDCELIDSASNTGSRTVSRNIVYVDITDQDVHRYYPGNTDDGCRRVNISGKNVSWEKYGSGSECKDVSNVQVWMGDAADSPTPSPITTATITPTKPNASNTPTPVIGATLTITPTLPPNTATLTPTVIISATLTPTEPAVGGISSTPTPTVTPTLPPGVTATVTPTNMPSNTPTPGGQIAAASPTPTGSTLPNAGSSTITVITFGIGTLLVAFALLLAL